MKYRSTNYTTALGANLDVSIVGGKGAQLGEMLRAGFPVPSGFNVTAQAYQRFLKENRIGPLIRETIGALDANNQSNLADKAEGIQTAMANGSIADEIENEIRSTYRQLSAEVNHANKSPGVAIRSSATTEDLPGASFAGQHDTYLNVPDEDRMIDSIKRCWASLWNQRAIYYRKRLGLDPLKLSMSVVVQEMVCPVSSGVMFTVNPITEDRSEMLINSTWGLGEAIVSGLVTPDSVVVAKPQLRIKTLRLACKELMIATAEGGGTVEAPVLTEKMSTPSISEEEIVRLGRFGIALEDHFSSPRDIEWSITAHRLFILQSRAITVRQPRG